MKRALIPLSASLVLGSAVWAVEATPLSSSPATPSQDYSPIEKVGCMEEGKCPYGYTIKKLGVGKGYSCEPCWDQKQGSRYRDDHNEYYEPRRYREYGD